MEGFNDQETEEARAVRPAQDPGAPTNPEYERHMHTHIHAVPCMVSLVHRRAREETAAKEGDETEVPVVAMGFCYITPSGTPVLCLKCSRTGLMGPHTMRSKEVTPELVQLLATAIDNMGLTRVVLKSDNKPAMRALAGRVE